MTPRNARKLSLGSASREFLHTLLHENSTSVHSYQFVNEASRGRNMCVRDEEVFRCSAGILHTLGRSSGVLPRSLDGKSTRLRCEEAGPVPALENRQIKKTEKKKYSTTAVHLLPFW